MKSIFDSATKNELISRISSLNANSSAKWGKMNVYQMLKHCIQWEEMLLGKKQYKQSFMGKIFGKIALKSMMKDEPMKPNLPTVPSFKVTGTGDVQSAKTEWIDLLKQQRLETASNFIHPFFGELTPEVAGRMAYKHIDHHLKQFGV